MAARGGTASSAGSHPSYLHAWNRSLQISVFPPRPLLPPGLKLPSLAKGHHIPDVPEVLCNPTSRNAARNAPHRFVHSWSHHFGCKVATPPYNQAYVHRQFLDGLPSYVGAIRDAGVIEMDMNASARNHPPTTRPPPLLSASQQSHPTPRRCMRPQSKLAASSLGSRPGNGGGLDACADGWGGPLRSRLARSTSVWRGGVGADYHKKDASGDLPDCRVVRAQGGVVYCDTADSFEEITLSKCDQVESLHLSGRAYTHTRRSASLVDNGRVDGQEMSDESGEEMDRRDDSRTAVPRQWRTQRVSADTGTSVSMMSNLQPVTQDEFLAMKKNTNVFVQNQLSIQDDRIANLQATIASLKITAATLQADRDSLSEQLAAALESYSALEVTVGKLQDALKEAASTKPRKDVLKALVSQTVAKERDQASSRVGVLPAPAKPRTDVLKTVVNFPIAGERVQASARPCEPPAALPERITPGRSYVETLASPPGGAAYEDLPRGSHSDHPSPSLTPDNVDELSSCESHQTPIDRRDDQVSEAMSAASQQPQSEETHDITSSPITPSLSEADGIALARLPPLSMYEDSELSSPHSSRARRSLSSDSATGSPVETHTIEMPSLRSPEPSQSPNPMLEAFTSHSDLKLASAPPSPGASGLNTDVYPSPLYGINALSLFALPQEGSVTYLSPNASNVLVPAGVCNTAVSPQSPGNMTSIGGWDVLNSLRDYSYGVTLYALYQRSGLKPLQSPVRSVIWRFAAVTFILLVAFCITKRWAGIWREAAVFTEVEMSVRVPQTSLRSVESLYQLGLAEGRQRRARLAAGHI
ncbi:hypothetical protein EIP91_004919 [Steccherinum ochraceum]|uniref:Uncharacterized protein n=1 Tax=Steccherinum ochraceum TaxID=92696 RepID=A0A4R0RNA3_9APHY|nr:hypothetical protein EIP91_004919 [Steccherinum ochraceum]